MEGKDSFYHEPSKPCWEGVALGWRRDVPDSLRLKSRGGEYLQGCRGGSGVVLQSEEEPASLSSVRSDSCLNSMEYWDYTVELECIQGHQVTAETAEVDKDLVERNKELEQVGKFQQDTIQDQAMRIEHLCRQTSLMKEMTDSRTKVYEQMEVAVNNLEETNARMVDEALADKNKIRMLMENVETVEERCMDLQMCLECTQDTVEVGLMEQVEEREENEETRRKESIKQIQINRERKATEERELLMELSLSRMSDKMMLLEQENRESRCLVKELEGQVVTLMKENRILREITSDTNERKHISVQEELAAFSHSEPMEKTDQEISESKDLDAQDELIAQLDTQYRALIDKYEDLLELFNQTKRENQSQDQSNRYQMSLQEELSSSEYRVDIMDMMNISHDVSLNISYEMSGNLNNGLSDVMTQSDENCDDTMKNEKEMETCPNEEKEDTSWNAERKTETIRDDIENENCTEEEKTSDKKHGSSDIIDYRQSALHVEQDLMDRDHVKICHTNSAIKFSGQNNKFSDTNDFAQKVNRASIDPRCEVLENVHIKPVNLHIGDVSDSLSEEQFNNDENMVERIYLHNFDSANDNFIANAHSDQCAVEDDFSSEEHSSVSSGFSEEIVEVMKVDRNCQTNIAISSKFMPPKFKGNSEQENYQTIFCQMFALLRKENNNM